AEGELQLAVLAEELRRLDALELVLLRDQDAQVAQLLRGLDVDRVAAAIELEVEARPQLGPAAQSVARLAAELAGQHGHVGVLRPPFCTMLKLSSLPKSSSERSSPDSVR